MQVFSLAQSVTVGEENSGQMPRQKIETENIEPVVFQDAHHQVQVLIRQPIEVHRRDQMTGYIAVTVEAEQLSLDIRKGAVRKPPPEKTAGRVQ